MPDLRPYQVANNTALRRLEDFGPVRAVSCMPTGGGKTVCEADMLLDDAPQVLLTHRSFLLDQISAELSLHGVEHGIMARGHRPNFAAPIQLGMIQTFYKRCFVSKKWRLPDAARIHIDEIHTVAAMMAQKICTTYWHLGASTIGWTASPYELSHLVDHQIVTTTVPQLIQQGWLVPPVMYGPDAPDLERLEAIPRQANGEYMPGAVKKVWDSKAIFGRVLANYHRINPEGRPAMLFAQGVPYSLWFAQRFSACGVKTAHIDGDDVWVDGKQYESDSAARKDIFERSKPGGDIKCISNFFVLREGFNAPWISHVIYTVPVGARHNWVQMGGRGLRSYPEKTCCTYQDHAGNWLRHPPLDSAEPWDIETSARTLAKLRIANLRAMIVDGVRVEPKEREPICCVKCFAIRLTGDECPVCGYRYSKRARPVVQVNGRLKLVYGPAYKEREIIRRKTDTQVWREAYWGSRQHCPTRTFEQIYCWAAKENNWNWLPRDLPLMPLSDLDWYKPVGDVPPEKLRILGEPSHGPMHREAGRSVAEAPLV
jgi:DNA repair protein RadD